MSGKSVSLSAYGTIVAIGANKNDGAGTGAGHVRVYEYSAGTYEYSDSTWTQLGSDIDGEAAGDRSGTSVSLSADGTIVAIGARNNDGTGSNAGHVTVYQYSDSTWAQLGSDIDGEATSDRSGKSVSLSADGTIVAIGARANDGTASNAGHVRVYQYTSNSWTQIGSDLDGEASNDSFGYAVSLNADGTVLGVGVRRSGANRGHVRVYALPSSPSPPALSPPPATPLHLQP
jgi:hypothetical protein